MEDPITRAEYEEYQKRMEQEDHRQNRRIEQLEENTKQINALTVSIEKLAQSVESMVREQEAQGKRLVSLESKRRNVEKSRWLCNNCGNRNCPRICIYANWNVTLVEIIYRRNHHEHGIYYC